MNDATSTTKVFLLPDGTYAAIVRQMTFGEAVIIILLVALVLMEIYALWRRP